MSLKTLYHGSDHVVGKPVFGLGDPHTDYGLGFYCAENIEIAKEWSARRENGSFVNRYTLETKGLKNLNLSSLRYTTLHWLAVLLRNRELAVDSKIATESKRFILEHFSVDVSGYDTITGYRADDSYFTFAMDFLNNTISVQMLTEAMKLGKLGEQFVLKSEKAFKRVEFISAEPVVFETYFKRRTDRDADAISRYAELRNKPTDKDALFVLDMIRNGVDEDDSRIR